MSMPIRNMHQTSGVEPARLSPLQWNIQKKKVLSGFSHLW